MPYGVRTDPTSNLAIDFDALFDEVFVPAATNAGCDAVRSDYESSSGIIHKSMFEQLLLADVVLADLSMPNCNVYYELGIRHATRPQATITLACRQAGAVPFDLALLRHVLYEVDATLPVDPTRLAADITERIASALGSPHAVDSPIFQTIVDYPGIELSHESSESYRDRVVSVLSLRRRLQEAVHARDRESIADVEAAVTGIPELLADVVLAWRDVEAWPEMLHALDATETLRRSAPGIELAAFARNRRNEPGDRELALLDLVLLEERDGPTSERASLRGRIHKDRWLEVRGARGDAAAFGDLLCAIDAYRDGLDADPRDPLPGVNLLTLLALARNETQLAEVGPVVAFALARRGGLKSRDYFDVAALCEAACVLGDEITARRPASLARGCPHAPWMQATTARNLRLLGEVHPLAAELASSFSD